MEKRKKYPLVRFTEQSLKEALSEFSNLGYDARQALNNFKGEIHYGELESWQLDSRDEFFAEYRQGYRSAGFALRGGEYVLSYTFEADEAPFSSVAMTGPKREGIESVFRILDRDASSAAANVSAYSRQSDPVIFIGHGHSTAWRDLKDHLSDHHGYAVQAYETGARSGHTVRDILHDLLESSSFAVLVLTAEDEVKSGEFRARQNVVHELGLFQGRLGYPRAIAVVEEGLDLFSNMDGVHQIRFNDGQIRQVYGDVLATLRREFKNGR